MSKTDKFVLTCLILSIILSVCTIWNTHQAKKNMQRAFEIMERTRIQIERR